MKGNFPGFLLYASIYLFSLGYLISDQTTQGYLLHPRKNITALTFLPGVLDLRGVTSSILGVESEVSPRDVVKFINIEREKTDTGVLMVNDSLEKAAKMRADIILKHQNPSHQDPFENIQLNTVLPIVGYPYIYASENIALANGSAAGFVAGWMNSPSHRQNLLDSKLKETGVGIAYGKVGDYYVTIAVQLFAIPTSLENFRGYSEAELINTKKIKEGVDAELLRTKNLVLTNGQSAYYSGWENILTRQKEVLDEIYDRMLSGMPYETRHYELISEYNENWQKAPK